MDSQLSRVIIIIALFDCFFFLFSFTFLSPPSEKLQTTIQNGTFSLSLSLWLSYAKDVAIMTVMMMLWWPTGCPLPPF